VRKRGRHEARKVKSNGAIKTPEEFTDFHGKSLNL
jgi:hypothetical protein